MINLHLLLLWCICWPISAVTLICCWCCRYIVVHLLICYLFTLRWHCCIYFDAVFFVLFVLHWYCCNVVIIVILILMTSLHYTYCYCCGICCCACYLLFCYCYLFIIVVLHDIFDDCTHLLMQYLFTFYIVINLLFVYNSLITFCWWFVVDTMLCYLMLLTCYLLPFPLAFVCRCPVYRTPRCCYALLDFAPFTLSLPDTLVVVRCLRLRFTICVVAVDHTVRFTFVAILRCPFSFTLFKLRLHPPVCYIAFTRVATILLLLMLLRLRAFVAILALRCWLRCPFDFDFTVPFVALMLLRCIRCCCSFLARYHTYVCLFGICCCCLTTLFVTLIWFTLFALRYTCSVACCCIRCGVSLLRCPFSCAYCVVDVTFTVVRLLLRYAFVYVAPLTLRCVYVACLHFYVCFDVLFASVIARYVVDYTFVVGLIPCWYDCWFWCLTLHFTVDGVAVHFVGVVANTFVAFVGPDFAVLPLR